MIADLFPPLFSDELLPIDLADIRDQVELDWLRTMCLIREFELACEPLSLKGKIPGAVHSSVGQEAVAVGAIRALRPIDVVAGPHRDHHHALAHGMDPGAVMAELFGKGTGVRGGRGGTMHLANLSGNFIGGNGIVGAGAGIAMGAALAAKIRGSGEVALAFIGDGGANTGRTWEALNMAAVWDLPYILVCENNQYAVETAVGRVTAGESIARRAESFGLQSTQVDGQDVAAVYRATLAARDRAVAGDGPSFIEALTYRYQGHSSGEVVTYREPADVEQWRRRKDPLERLWRALEARDGTPAVTLDELLVEARAVVAEAIEFAESSPEPDVASATTDVTGLDVRVRGNV